MPSEHHAPETERTGRRAQLLWSIGLLLLIAGAWFGWGVMSSAAFESRVEHLRAKGAIARDGEGFPPEVADDENGIGILVAAMQTALATENAIDDDLMQEGTYEQWLENHGEFETWSDWAKEHEHERLRAIEGSLAQIETALARPHLQARPDDTGADFASVFWAAQRLHRVARAHPERRDEAVRRLMRMIHRWPLRPGDAALHNVMWNALALPQASALLRSHRPEATDAGWQAERAILAEAEARLLTALRVQTLWTRRGVIEVLEGWREGVDPRKADNPAIGRLGALSPEKGQWEPDARTAIREHLARNTVIAGPSPYPGPFLRPLLQDLAHDIAMDIPDEPPAEGTVGSLRARVAAMPEVELHMPPVAALWTLATLRLARAAMAVADHLAAGRRDGGPVELTPADEPVDLRAIRAILPVRDALTGKAFEVVIDGDHVVVRAPVSTESTRHRWPELLFWTVPFR